MTTIQNIALNKLVMSKANVRKTGAEEGIAELAASIAAHGLRQNLNVREADKGRFEVVAGGRRLRALKKLVKDGLMAKDAEVPCRVLAEGEDASEISLVENAMREPMHPDDQFVAFQQLVEAGKSVEDVAARFGVTPAVVERRLKLARVSPKLREAFRKGDLTLEQMMAFAVSDDHEQQEEVCKNLTHWNSSAREIRAALTSEAVALSEPLAKFVTADTYLAAGGVIQRDLFDEANEGYMADRALALSLANYRLEAAMADIKAEGWKWVKAEVERDYSVHYGRVYPDYDGEGEERIARYADEDVARAGAIVRIGHDGNLAVERGFVHPDDREQEGGDAKTKEPKDAAAIPASVVKELSAHRTAAMQAALARNPEVALAVTVYTLALPLFGGSATDSCLQIGLKAMAAAEAVSVREDCNGHAAMASEAEMWGDRLPGRPSDLFDWCLAQPQDVLLSLLAFCAASSVNGIKEKFDADTSPRLAHADGVATALNLDMAEHWTPSVVGFYGKLTKAGLLTVAKDAKAELAIVVSDVKKDVAARHVMQAVAKTDWLPPAFGDRIESQGNGDLAQAA
jgi:ParB family chromosome partitioning protein